ncbi:type II toxin-antitoxin system PemK/MazF family toxin [Mobilicoccus caccae]|uniref:mRNA interferase n=1 Tax=Mobilicoccus caccae TaxID=1859295 RepID=A0ABQ6IVX5_9MICO|nr:type II toxin-antitoxin system PemK/MazF family toxin [Mobilicoccus caccae]GMA40882.1 endoribonuclease MazF9 [Mobilicoccus caccae]
MRRGDIVWVALDPAVGSEADKVRPAVVVGRDSHTRTSLQLERGVVTVVPLTSNTARVLSFQALLPASATGLARDSKAQAEQVRSVDVSRLRGAAGHLPSDVMAEVDAALRLHLAL